MSLNSCFPSVVFLKRKQFFLKQILTICYQWVTYSLCIVLLRNIQMCFMTIVILFVLCNVDQCNTFHWRHCKKAESRACVFVCLCVCVKWIMQGQTGLGFDPVCPELAWLSALFCLLKLKIGLGLQALSLCTSLCRRAQHWTVLNITALLPLQMHAIYGYRHFRGDATAKLDLISMGDDPSVTHFLFSYLGCSMLFYIE